MSDTREIHVRMCELKVGGSGDILRATLGSCVGIGLLWRSRRIYGLAHCLLPQAPQPSTALTAKYVNQAVPALFSLMGLENGQRDQVEAVLAGGACIMQQPIFTRQMIGDQNVQAAERMLAAAGIRIVHSDVGGTHGRQLLLDGELHQYTVRKIGRPT